MAKGSSQDSPDGTWIEDVREHGLSELQIKQRIVTNPKPDVREQLTAQYLETVHPNDREQVSQVLNYWSGQLQASH